jgi:hypothetical protein
MNDAELLAAAKARAEAYARQRPGDDVPAGWILEEASVPGTFHYRRARAGSQYGPPYSTRQAALAAIEKEPAVPVA